MKAIRYIGGAHIREYTEEDLETAYGFTVSGGLRFDRRKDAHVEVSNALADKLIEDGEWEVAALLGEPSEEEVAEEKRVAKAKADAAEKAAKGLHVDKDGNSVDASHKPAAPVVGKRK